MGGFGTLPQFPEPSPFLSLPDSLFETGEQTRLMSVIMLPIRGNVHGARLKPCEVI
jgi:hypothetical protein